jgi:autotransporter-associated beta strand protein
VTLQSADISANAGSLVLSNDVTVSGTAGLLNGGSGAYAGRVDLGGVERTFDVDNSGSGLTISASVTNGALTKTDSGTLTLSGANTYTGNTTVHAGTLALGADNAVPLASTLYVDTVGTFDVAGFKQTLGGDITHILGTVHAGAAGTVAMNFSSSQSFYGTLTGPGNLTLNGGGTMNLIGTNNLGSTVVTNNSTYLVNGLHSGGVITAYGGSTVGGTGYISALNVNGGTYAPGNGIGTQMVASLTLTNAGVLALALGNNANSLVLVTNSLTLAGGQLQLNLAAYSFAVGSTITLVDYSTATGFNSGDPAQWFTLNDALGPNDGLVWSNGLILAVSGGTSTTNLFQINYDGLANGLGQPSTITLTAVPEPGTASLLGLIGVAWLVRRIRRRHRAQG